MAEAGIYADPLEARDGSPGTVCVLVVDDEENIRSLLLAALEHFGFDVLLAGTGRDALAIIESGRPDLVILDVMLPDLDGFEVCRRSRVMGLSVPILFLSARDATTDAVRGLTAGADDYMTKPFAVDEVIVRIRAALRRARQEMTVLRCEDLEMNDRAHVVVRNGVTLDLSPTEYTLLRYLLRNAGAVVSRHELFENVWGSDWLGRSNVIETYIGYLRRKIDAAGPSLIQTVRGFGYVLRQGDGP